MISHTTAIATIGASVTGITTAFAVAPAKLDTAELPALYILTGNARVDESILGKDFAQITRIYRVQVAGIPLGLATPEARETLVQPILDATVLKFLAYPSLNGVAGVQSCTPLSDSGIVILPEYGLAFVGFEMPLQVVYDVDRIYAAHE